MRSIQALIFIIVLLSGASHSFAGEKSIEQSKEYYKKTMGELLVTETEIKADIGSRSGSRDMLEAKVPIDVITAEQLERAGTAELSKILQKYIPGFNFPRPSIADGTDHARPFTLRGLNPDQVLVLINGKRVHQSSLLNVMGTIGRGASSVDLNTIPVRAIERVEVLRDGAAAQYGSDAIAGIINIVLKGYGHRSVATTTYGGTSKGDGVVKQMDMFYSYPLKYDGFLNLSMELRDREATNRAGLDMRDQYYPPDDVRNDLPDKVNGHYGDSEALDKIVNLNVERPNKDGVIYYVNANGNERDGEAGALFRRPSDGRNNVNLYPYGFLPVIAPNIQDYTMNFGVKGSTYGNYKWDISYGRGYNKYHFFVENTHNDSLGDTSPTSFDAGGTTYDQQIANIDVSRKFPDLHIAGGVEAREETYTIFSGDEASYIMGEESNNAGAQGFPGFQPGNEVDESRHNLAAYLDVNYNVTNNLLVEGAGRFEHYSDFGSTLDGKLALSLNATEDVLFRASGSTGFRAPSLSQSYYTSTTTTRSTDLLYQTGTFRVDHPVSVALGAKDLDAEKSTHFTGGAVYQPHSDFSVSADYFYTKIDDRIMLSGNITETVSEEVKGILNAYGVGRAKYFTNAVSTETNGIDLRLNYKHAFSCESSLKFTASYNYSTTEVTDINNTPSILGNDGQNIIVSDREIITIEKGQPRESVKLYTFVKYKPFNLALTLNRFGSFSSVYGDSTYHFGAEWTTDVEVSYDIVDNLRIAVGGENIFDIYPDKWGVSESTIAKQDFTLQYSQYSPFGFNGAYYYARLEYRF